MRTIKFRVRNTKTNQWVYGPDEHSDLDGVNLFGETILFGELLSGVPINDINDCVALQYTGRKDKNGKQIFEGDILQFKSHRNFDQTINVGVVEYNENEASFQLVILQGKRYNETFWMARDLVVLGNIFDNPELKSKIIDPKTK